MTSASYRLNRRTALRLAAGAAATGPLLVPVARQPQAQTLDKVSIQTDWRAQAEHGGYYQAIATGLYRKAGIECDVRQGGPSLNISLLLMAGRVDMTMSGSFEAFTFVRENAPFFTIGAIFQKDPQVLIGHPDTGFDSFEKLRGRPILIGAGGRVTYWPYLRKKYGLSDDQLRPYNYSLAPFLADKNMIQQGFLSSEPYPITQALGRPPSVLLIADAGYIPYQATIAISRKMAQEKKDLERLKADHGGEPQFYANMGIAPEQVELVRQDIAVSLRVNKLMERLVAADAEPTEAELRAYYEANFAAFTTPEQRRASHISKGVSRMASREGMLDEFRDVAAGEGAERAEQTS